MRTKKVWLTLPGMQADELERVAKLHGVPLNELIRRALEAQGYGSAAGVTVGRPKGGR